MAAPFLGIARHATYRRLAGLSFAQAWTCNVHAVRQMLDRSDCEGWLLWIRIRVLTKT
jgi:hypothetical protein